MTGKVAIITGASRGVGAGLVIGYRGRGWAVVASARRIKPLEDRDVVVVEGDIAEPATADRIIGTALDAERLCEQINLTPGEMLTYLRSRGCPIGGVTMGAKGLLWYDETKNERFLPALDVPERLVIDTTAPATSFTVPTSIRIWSIPMPSGSSTSSSRARHRHIRSSISATCLLYTSPSPRD